MQNHYFGGSNPPVASNSLLLGAALALTASCAPAIPDDVSYVQWRGADAPVDRPLAVFVDGVGGPAERASRDLDATTFLNDRFHPLRVPAFGAQPVGTLAFYTADGCPFGPAFTPADGASIIAAANAVIVQPAASGRHAARAAPRACSP